MTRGNPGRFAAAGLLVASVTAGCGGSSAGSSTPTGPSNPAGPAPVTVVVLTGGASIVDLPDKPVAVSYNGCWSIRGTTSAHVTVTREIIPLGADGAPYPTFSYVDPYLASDFNSPTDYSSGCGGPMAYDFDFTHPLATSYRLRVHWQQDGGGSGYIEGVAGIAIQGITLPPRIVINEFRTRGPNGPTDQFVELFNQSLTPSTGSAVLSIRPTAGGPTSAFFVPATIGPLCHYLMTGPGYSGSVKGDLALPALLGDEGSLRYSSQGTERFLEPDTVGMNSSLYEGTPLAPFPSINIDRSYARTGVDSNDNGRDFALRSPGTPQNSSVCGSR